MRKLVISSQLMKWIGLLALLANVIIFVLFLVGTVSIVQGFIVFGVDIVSIVGLYFAIALGLVDGPWTDGFMSILTESNTPRRSHHHHHCRHHDEEDCR